MFSFGFFWLNIDFAKNADCNAVPLQQDEFFPTYNRYPIACSSGRDRGNFYECKVWFTDVAWASWRLKWTVTTLIFQQLVRADIECQNSASLAIYRGNHWSPSHKGPILRKAFSYQDFFYCIGICNIMLYWTGILYMHRLCLVYNIPIMGINFTQRKLLLVAYWFCCLSDSIIIYITNGVSVSS